MNRRRYLLVALANLLLVANGDGQPPGLPEAVRSEARVKASASASKIDGDGKQLVTVTLDIQKGWLLYANPVKYTEGPSKWEIELETIFEMNRTRVFVEPKDKVTYLAKYPGGRTIIDGKVRFNVYESRVVIPVNIERKPGDTSSLRIKIFVHATDIGFRGPCQHPGVITLSVP